MAFAGEVPLAVICAGAASLSAPGAVEVSDTASDPDCASAEPAAASSKPSAAKAEEALATVTIRAYAARTGVTMGVEDAQRSESRREETPRRPPRRTRTRRVARAGAGARYRRPRAGFREAGNAGRRRRGSDRRAPAAVRLQGRPQARERARRIRDR